MIRKLIPFGLMLFLFAAVPVVTADRPDNLPTADLSAINAFGSGIGICTAPIAPVTLVNPTTVTNCTRAGIQEALNGGGHINFSCGPNPITIPIDQTLELNGQDTVIDGGGLVTLDGQNNVKILEEPYTPNAHTVTIQNMRFINGRAPASSDLGTNSGGAIRIGDPGARLHVINSTFENNNTRSTAESDNQGGAIFASNMYETVIVGSVFEGNTAGNGGAIGGLATGMILVNNHFTNNQAVDTTAGGIVRGYGGALHLDGVRNGYNPNSNKQVTVCGSIFENNSAVRGGGALASVVSDNYGTKYTVEKSTFNSNVVTGLNGQYGQGGAIYHIEDDHNNGRNEDNLEITQSTFYANEAGRQGGGVWLYILGRGEVTNSTFESNRTIAGFNNVGQGGAMALNLGILNITNVTFAHNHADYQGGAIMAGGANADKIITLKNTIFLDNTLNIGQTQPSETKWQGFHTNRPLTDGGQNIQYPENKPTYNNKVNNNITANPIYQDPLLEPLADNAGYNLTMALQTGSPAINTGAAGCPAVDQRDAPRVGPCDIGAYEFAGTPPNANALQLTVQATDLNDTLNSADTIGYRITIHSRDTAVISGVMLTNTLPAALTFGGWVDQGSATVNGDTVTWGPQDLASGQTATFVFTATVSAPLSTAITNTVTAQSAAGETATAEATFTVGQDPETLLFLPFITRP
ncbi:MAG: hypothetical protein KDE51_23610 [Anaerolineales bacterium]|nr:hypothetical protein [Anaerolineales bacterium]